MVNCHHVLQGRRWQRWFTARWWRQRVTRRSISCCQRTRQVLSRPRSWVGEPLQAPRSGGESGLFGEAIPVRLVRAPVHVLPLSYAVQRAVGLQSDGLSISSRWSLPKGRNCVEVLCSLCRLDQVVRGIGVVVFRSTTPPRPFTPFFRAEPSFCAVVMFSCWGGLFLSSVWGWCNSF